MTTLSNNGPSSTRGREPAPHPRRVTKREVHHFLLAFANHGWSTPKSADQRRAEFHWFETHRTFAQLLPAPPPEFPGIAKSIRVEWASDIVAVWRARLRDLWGRARGLGESATKDKLLDHALWYSGMRSSPEFQGEMAARIAKARPSEGFLRALFHLRDLAGRLRRCRNRRCQNPFFFSSPEHESYCSRACTRIGELERKRRAWHRHKNEWRPPKSKGGKKPKRKGGK